MRKTIVIAILAVITATVALTVLSGEKPMENNVLQDKASSEQPTQQLTSDESASGGKYIEHSEAAVAQANGTRLLFFHAPWCPQCRALETSIRSGVIPENVTIFKVDYDSSQALRQKHGVTIQTTIIRLDESGNTAEKYVAYDNPTLENILMHAL